MSNAAWECVDGESECPTCGSRPVEPHDVQHDGPAVVLVCINNHLYSFDTEAGEVV